MWAVALGIAAAGCHFAPRQVKTPTGRQPQKDIALTLNQIRLGIRALVGPMCGEIEQAADVAEVTTSLDNLSGKLEVYREQLVWQAR